MDERAVSINIGGKDYELILTTKATKAIAGRYGGLENLGEKLMKSENLTKSCGLSQPLRIKRFLFSIFATRATKNSFLPRKKWSC